jgi:hypothetical protein
VHGLVGDLRRELVGEQVERAEREPVEIRARRSVAEIGRQAVAHLKYRLVR